MVKLRFKRDWFCHGVKLKNLLRTVLDIFSQEEIDAVSGFPLVFLVSLSERSDICGIDGMILEQIIPKLRNDFYTFLELEHLMVQERCLVILDGLDEWNHPSDSGTCRPRHGNAPHRRARVFTTITTTRPWKLAVDRVKASQISEKIEYVRLSQDLANELKRLVISKIRGETDEYRLRKYVNCFNRVVMEKELTDLEGVPLLLLCLLCIWCDGTELKQTRCRLYSILIDFLLSGNSCNESDYSESLRYLTKMNKQNIKSVYIGTYDTCYKRAQEVMEYFDLKDLENLV